MYGRLSVITPPTGYPVTVDLVKSHTRIDSSADDALLAVYIGSATSTVESFLNRALLTQQLKYSIADSFPNNSWPLVPAPILILPLAMEWTFSHLMQKDVELPRSPVASVESVTYSNWGDLTETTLTDGYFVDLAVEPARVRLDADVPWISGQHITINYTAGYGLAADIPTPIIHAILLTVASFNENRGDMDAGDLPAVASSLLWNYRLYTFR
jgi:hypothetical protein